MSPQLPGPPQAALHLVKDEQGACLVAQLAEMLQVFLGGRVNASLPLQRLHNDSRRLSLRAQITGLSSDGLSSSLLVSFCDSGGAVQRNLILPLKAALPLPWSQRMTSLNGNVDIVCIEQSTSWIAGPLNDAAVS